MNNYRRDDLWDAATWADLNQAVLDEVQKVRVARKVFPTEDLSTATGGAPSWVSTGAVKRRAGANALHIPEGNGQPFVEITVRFEMTPAQVEAENTLHTARTLARMAAKNVALAEDHIVLGGEPVNFPVEAVVANRDPSRGVALFQDRSRRVKSADVDASDAQKLLDTVTRAMADLARKGWPEPYALFLGQKLYVDSFSRLHPNSEESPERRLAGRLTHLIVSGALAARTGILVSLAGDPISIYSANEAFTSFTGESFGATGRIYNFTVSESIQFTVRDDTSIVVLQG